MYVTEKFLHALQMTFINTTKEEQSYRSLYFSKRSFKIVTVHRASFTIVSIAIVSTVEVSKTALNADISSWTIAFAYGVAPGWRRITLLAGCWPRLGGLLFYTSPSGILGILLSTLLVDGVVSSSSPDEVLSSNCT